MPPCCTLPAGPDNGERFPFDRPELRGLDDAIFEDCMTVLRMDARLTAREVHSCFNDGHRKFAVGQGARRCAARGHARAMA